MIFHVNRPLAADSHLISCLIIFKKEKMWQNVSSVAVVISALRAK